MKERHLILLSGARRAFASKKMRRVGVIAAITMFTSLVFSLYFPQAYDVLKTAISVSAYKADEKTAIRPGPLEKKVNRSHKGSAEARTSSLMNVAGDWQGMWTFTEFLSGRRQNNFTMKIIQKGSQITGTTSEVDVFTNQLLVCEISGSIKNKKFRFLKKCGLRSYVTYEGFVTDDGRSAKGSFRVDQRPDFWNQEWSMTRISDANGHPD